jgi:hypothetical protein
MSASIPTPTARMPVRFCWIWIARRLGWCSGCAHQSKAARRIGRGYAPWVKILHAQHALAPNAHALLESARNLRQPTAGPPSQSTTAGIGAAQASAIYHYYVHLWRIPRRPLQPDWSIVDLWVARHMLSRGMPPAAVQNIVRMGSPLFPPAARRSRRLSRSHPRSCNISFSPGSPCVTITRSRNAAEPHTAPPARRRRKEKSHC